MKKPASKSNSPSTWNGPVVKALQNIYGHVSPLGMFTSKARDIRNIYHISGPAFNPYEYAAALGIKVEEDSSLSLDGFVRKNSKGIFVVTLNTNVPKSRRRFTLAHEIAHTFFYNEIEEFGIKFRGDRVFDHEEERLCDAAAAEILMPSEYFGNDLRGLQMDEGIISPVALFDISKRYDVSLTAAGIRTSKLIDKMVCVMWDKGRTTRPSWSSTSSGRKLMLCETGSSSVEVAFSTPGKIVTRNDRFYLDKRWIVRTASSLGLRSSNQVLTIIQPKVIEKHSASSHRRLQAKVTSVRETASQEVFEIDKCGSQDQLLFEWPAS